MEPAGSMRSKQSDPRLPSPEPRPESGRWLPAPPRTGPAPHRPLPAQVPPAREHGGCPAWSRRNAILVPYGEVPWARADRKARLEIPDRGRAEGGRGGR